MRTASPPTTPQPATLPVDHDLAHQAQPGHGIPSQDPDPGAQQRLQPAEAEREAHSVLVGGGALAGAAAGASIGVAVAGPVGVLVGAMIGAGAGALGGAAAGGLVQQDAPSAAEAGAAADAAVHLHVEDSGGSGRPVLLIHGWPLSAQAWAPQVDALRAAGFRVVAYDRRGFGRSDKPAAGYTYDSLADDLQRVIDQCGLDDVSLVGFSMGGGEVARFTSRCGAERLHSLVFAAAVTPCLLQSPLNPEGPLTPEKAREKRQAMAQDRDAYFDTFTRAFYAADGVLLVSEAQRREALALCQQSAQHAALACMDAFAGTDFRADLAGITLPTLVLHGDADAIVPLEGSGRRTHQAVAGSQLVVVKGAPHGMNLSHAEVFNQALLQFLKD